MLSRPRRWRRSIIGTMVPRRFITPRIYSGVFGRGVTVSQPLISRTLRILTPYSASSKRNVRYCLTSLPTETQQPRDVQDEGYRAITKNRGARDPFDALEVRLQALDDHLLLTEKL